MARNSLATTFALIAAMLYSNGCLGNPDFRHEGPNWIGDHSGDTSFVVGRFNNDRLDDLALCFRSSQILVWTQTQEGGFETWFETPIWMPAYSHNALVNNCTIHPDDIDGDGKTDLVVSHSAGVTVLRNRGEGAFDRTEMAMEYQGPGTTLGHSILVSSERKRSRDLIAHQGNGRLLRWRNIGGGRFEEPGEIGWLAPDSIVLAKGDLNGDGVNDLVVGYYQLKEIGTEPFQTGFEIHYGDGAASFMEPVTIYLPPQAAIGHIAIGDVTGDGRDDVVLTSNNVLVVFPQTSSGAIGQFQAYSAFDAPSFALIADVDNDGLNDVVVNHPGWFTLSLFKQREGILHAQPLLARSQLANNWDFHRPNILAVGRLDDNRCPDIILGTSGAYHFFSGLNCNLDTTPLRRSRVAQAMASETAEPNSRETRTTRRRPPMETH